MENAQRSKHLVVNCKHSEHLVNPYIDGELTPYHRYAFEEHYKQCPECRKLVQEMYEVKRMAASLNNKPIPEPVKLRLREYLARNI